jgi:hypothetical protein
MIPIRDTERGATFQVRVHPRAHKDGITGTIGEALKLSLTAPPVEGKANEACVRFLAGILGVARGSITIVAGSGNRQKVVCVAGLSADEARARLERLSET